MTGLALLLTAVVAASPPTGMIETELHEVRFVHRPRHRSEARELGRMTPSITRALRRELGLRRFPPVEVRVAQSPDDLRALAPNDPPPPAGALGVAYPRRGLVVISLSAGAQTLPIALRALYTHELSHVALGEAVGHRPIPRWFAEGVAMRHSKEMSWGRLEALWGATVSGNLVPIDRLDRAFPAGDHQDTLAYAESGEFVGFLAEGDRPGALAELCGRIRAGVPFRQALEANYATDLEELQKQFFATLQRRFSIIPALTGMGAIWGVVSLLLVLAWRRKKREARTKLARWEKEERAEDVQAAEPEAVTGDAGAMMGHFEEREAEPAPPPLPDEASAPDGMHRVYRDGRYHTVH
jgi:hypothetical protein